MIGSRTLNRAWQRARNGYRTAYTRVGAALGVLGGYAAAQIDRFTRGRIVGAPTSENQQPYEHYARLRWQAWKLFRDKPQFRKIVRNLCAKIVGSEGLTPRSGAMKTTVEGDVPATNFRVRAQQLWKEQSARMDYAGLPGQGGETQAGLEMIALIACILSGEILYKVRPLSADEQKARSAPAPVAVQLIDASRLVDDMSMQLPEGHFLYRGIEFDKEMRRYRYWLTDPGFLFGVQVDSVTPKPYPASDFKHVFVKDDVDQLRGVSWFAPMLQDARDFADASYNVLKAYAVQCCVVMGYRLGAGKTRFGQTGDTNDDLTDDRGNVINRLSSAMAINLGKDGDIKMFSPNIQTGNESFLQFIIRGICGAIPGMKSSTVTGDYRNSSFSSERSADNDAWPELEVIQTWFSKAFNQPIYEEVVTAAVADGYFDGIVTAGEFKRNKAKYLACEWQGPVARSINPVDDAQAATLRIKGGTSTPFIEAAKVGLRFEDVIHGAAQARQLVEDAGLPEVYFNSIMGLDNKDLISTAETAESTANGGSNVSKE